MMKQMKKLALLLALLLVTVALAACGGGSGGSQVGTTSGADNAAQHDGDAQEGADSASGDKLVLRLANSHNAEHITSQACQMFADLVGERTEGRIEIQTFFAGQLGDERSTIEQAMFGGLDFTRVSSGASAEFAPLMDALQMPYLYDDVDHLFRVLGGEIGQEVFDTFQNNNLVGISYLHPGSRCFFNSVREIHTPADLSGLKIRVSESQVMISLMEALGGIATPMPFNDTYSAIQTGVVDGAENNIPSYIEMSFYEVAPYWTFDDHSFMPDMILASKQTMDQLSEEDQAIIFEAAAEASAWHRVAWTEAEEENIQIAMDKGCTLTILTNEEKQLFRDAVESVYDILSDEQAAIVDRVRAA